MVTAIGSLVLASMLMQSAPPAPPSAPPSSRPSTTPPAAAPSAVPLPTGAAQKPQSSSPAGVPAGRPSAAPPTATPPVPAAPVVGEDGMIDGPPPIQVEPTVLDFGFIAPKQVSKGTFKLWNRGTAPLTVLAVQPSCKCTTTNDLADAVIKPGEFVELEASLDGAPLPSPRKANIKVLIDGYSRVLELELKGEVTYPLRAPPGYLNVVKGHEQKGRIVVESIDKKPFRICNIQGEAPDYIGFDPTKDEAKASYLVRWDITKFGDKIPPYLIVVSDREDCPILPIRVRHESTIPRPIFRLKEYSVNLGLMAPGQPTEVEVQMEDPGEALLAVATEDEHARAELVSTRVEEGTLTAKVRVTARQDHEGLLQFPLSFYSASKEMAIPAFGIVRSSGKSACGDG